MGEGTTQPTLLFTDIEASTQLLRSLGAAYPPLLATHFGLITSAIDTNGGTVAKVEGDGLLAVFDSAISAVTAALEAQRALQRHQWPDGAQVRVRMGLHTGDAAVHNGEYLGLGIHQAARVVATAHGAQVVASSATVDLLDDGVAMVDDLGAFALRDFDRPEHVFQLGADGLLDDFPALRARPAVAHNLPTIRTEFIGRDRERREVVKLLETNRLVTVLGAGGVGKTRLSFELARERAAHYFDGAVVVLLASVTDDRVIATVADALGVREEAGRPLRDTLCSALARQQMLVVFDNCEHVIEEVAGLVDEILDRTDSIAMITTSRRPLDIAGEAVYQLGPLDPPSEKDPTEALAANDAVRLFVERAQAAASWFALDDVTAPQVAQICRHVDGLPLAIELAAARVRSLPVAALVERLANTTKVLTTGPRSVDERQRTVTALVDWSYDLLTEDERRLFRRLSVFRGGFDLAAAEAMDKSDDIIDLLDSLVQHSLIALAEDGRYRVLVVVRDVAAAYLAASDEANAVRDRHLRHFAELAAAAPKGWWHRVGVELDNIRAALAWGLEGDGDRNVATRLLVDAWRFFRRRGFASELRQWNELVPEPADRATWMRLELSRLTLAPATEVAGRVDELEPEIRASGNATDLAWFQQRRLDAAEATGSTVATLAAVKDDIDFIVANAEPLAAARFVHMMSWNSYRSGDFAGAQNYAAQGARIAERIDDPESGADFNYLHAVFAIATGDIEATAKFTKAAREGYESTGSVGLVQVLNVQAAMYSLAGDLPGACVVYEDTAIASRAASLRHMEAIALANQADALVSLGRYDEAEHALDEGTRVADELSLVFVQHLLTCFRANLEYARGDLDAMAIACEQSAALADQMNTPDTRARTAQATVYLRLAQRDAAGAVKAAQEGAANLGDVTKGDASGQLAAALREAGDVEGALEQAMATLALPRPYPVMTPRLALMLAVAFRGKDAVRLGEAALVTARDLKLVIPAPEIALIERVLEEVRSELGDDTYDAIASDAISRGLADVFASTPV